jgi:hypothetical protein
LTINPIYAQNDDYILYKIQEVEVIDSNIFAILDSIIDYQKTTDKYSNTQHFIALYFLNADTSINLYLENLHYIDYIKKDIKYATEIFANYDVKELLNILYRT